MHAARDRTTAAPAARDRRPATAQRARPRLDPAGLIALQRAVGNTATGAVLARLRVLARRPDEAKVRARAYELYQRGGGGVRSREEDEANYYEALRQVEIEERAYAIAQQRGGADPVANYYDAERDIAWEQLKTRPDVVYRIPPLTEAGARAVVRDVERAAPNALQGLQQQGRAFPAAGPQAEREHEWGILKARTRADECVLIIGEATGVTWSPFLHCGIAIAHSHPYFKVGAPRSRYGGVSTQTKEIADHQIGGRQVPGAVLWSDLAGRTEINEMLKIFPSASDIAFSAKKGVARHTVYTTYLALRHPAGRVIANPDFNGGAFAQQAPLLRFEIRDAAHVQNRDYGCELAAFEGNDEFWRKDVVTEGDGQFSPLTWS